MKRAILPPGWQDAKCNIFNMTPGEKCYTVPWNIEIDSAGALWIDGSVSASYKQIGGTASVEVKRVEGGVVIRRRDVDVNQIQERNPSGDALPVFFE